jgi:hypothetical protein
MNLIETFMDVAQKVLSKSLTEAQEDSLIEDSDTLWNAMSQDERDEVERRLTVLTTGGRIGLRPEDLLPEMPGLRQEAERLAKEHADTTNDMYRTIFTWDELPEFQRSIRIEVQVALLRNLNRPASRDWAVRWLWSQWSHGEPSSCPSWKRRGGHWSIPSPVEQGAYIRFCDKAQGPCDVAVPGIDEVNSADVALLMACVVVARAVIEKSQAGRDAGLSLGDRMRLARTEMEKP